MKTLKSNIILAICLLLISNLMTFYFTNKSYHLEKFADYNISNFARFNNNVSCKKVNNTFHTKFIECKNSNEVCNIVINCSKK